MAKTVGYAPSTIHRIWRAFGLQSHRSETFKLSNDSLLNVRVYLACGVTDIRRGVDWLTPPLSPNMRRMAWPLASFAQVQTALKADPRAGHLFIFRGRRGQ